MLIQIWAFSLLYCSYYLCWRIRKSSILHCCIFTNNCCGHFLLFCSLFSAFSTYNLAWWNVNFISIHAVFRNLLHIHNMLYHFVVFSLWNYTLTSFFRFLYSITASLYKFESFLHFLRLHNKSLYLCKSSIYAVSLKISYFKCLY